MGLALLQPGYDPAPQSRREKLRRLMANARLRNAIDLPALGAAGPTLTMLGATGTSGLGQAINHATNANLFTCHGGPAWNVAGSRYQAKSVTLSATPTFASYGQRWAWRTDSAKFDVAIFGSTSGTLNGFRLLVDGQYVSKAMLVPSVAGATQYLNVDWSAVNAAPAMRRYDLSFYGNGGNSFQGIAIGAADIAQPVSVAERYRIGIVGDSITLGTGATVESGGYAYQAGLLLGGVELDLVPIAIGGTGYSCPGGNWKFGDHIDDVTLQPLDELWFVGGVNDSALTYNTATLQANALAVFRAARTRLPAVPIVVWGAFAQGATSKAQNNAAEAYVKAAFGQWGDANSAFVDIQGAAFPPETGFSDVSGNGSRYKSGDSVHPSDAGHAMLGKWFAERRRALAL